MFQRKKVNEKMKLNEKQLEELEDRIARRKAWEDIIELCSKHLSKLASEGNKLWKELEEEHGLDLLKKTYRVNLKGEIEELSSNPTRISKTITK